MKKPIYHNIIIKEGTGKINNNNRRTYNCNKSLPPLLEIHNIKDYRIDYGITSNGKEMWNKEETQ